MTKKNWMFLSLDVGQNAALRCAHGVWSFWSVGEIGLR